LEAENVETPAQISGLDQLYPAHLATLMERADRALAVSRCDALVIGAGELKYRYLDDSTEHFVANPQFRAWVPVTDAPGSYVIYVPGKKPTLLFHQPEDYWHKPPSLPTEAWTRALEIQIILSPEDVSTHIPARAAYLGEEFTRAAGCNFIMQNPPSIVDPLHYARAVKTPYEIACMRLASTIGARAHVAAEHAYRAGASEYAIHLAYLAASGLREMELPYSNIIALNEGGAILHYTTLERVAPLVSRSLLIDAGGQYRGYGSDITRSYASEPGRYLDLLTQLDQAQQTLCRMVMPGVSYPDIHHAAHRLIAQILLETGIIHGSVDAAVASGLTSVFFPHGIGHLLGLQVHDIGGRQATSHGGTLQPPEGHPYLRLTRRLEAGVVVTIEPGIYFIDLLLKKALADSRGKSICWDVVEALRPFGGARIEDNVVTTLDEPENLTRNAFAAL
jgi:Xaa-Pro dipeptidase